MPSLTALENAMAEVSRGAVVAVNHSGGKDSQCMLIEVLRVVQRSQVVVFHADLDEVEWEGTKAHAAKQAADAGVPFIVAKATKTFFGMVEHRFATRPDAPSWPSASTRQCTSDLKRGPLEREIRRVLKARGALRVVSAMGMRAEESPKRAKREPWAHHKGNSIAGRSWFEWLPIQHHAEADVFETIRSEGQEPHWAYETGNERLSCVFCILSSKNDLRNGAIHNPELFEKYIEMEQKTGYTAHQSMKSLVEITGLTVEQARELNQKRRSLLVILDNEPAEECWE